MNPDNHIIVTGAGGFIGGHVIRFLTEGGYTKLRAVDIKPLEEWYQKFEGVENLVCDLREKHNCYRVTEEQEQVIHLAADMGGMGYIEQNRASCMLSILINAHMLSAARDHGVETFFFSSSACVYPTGRQASPDNPGLREIDAYPAMPERGYGWQKLFSEEMCREFSKEYGFSARIARFHNVYGPFGCYTGGREKAPAAICRKIAEATLSEHPEIEIWGDGNQTRSFMYIDDCVEGILRLMNASIAEPINLGSAEMVSINSLVDIVENVAGIKVARRYKQDAPLGVRGRSSDNTLIRNTLNWEPSTPLKEGIRSTYGWVYNEVMSKRKNHGKN